MYIRVRRIRHVKRIEEGRNETGCVHRKLLPLKWSRQVVERLTQLIEANQLQDKVALSGTFCMGNCQKGISATLDGKLFSLSPENVTSFLRMRSWPADKLIHPR